MALERTIENSEVVDTNVKKVNEKSTPAQKESEPAKAKGIILFVKQIIEELKKVTRPTPSELKEYVIVVIVFVLVIMLFITGVDLLIGKAVMALFSSNSGN